MAYRGRPPHEAGSETSEAAARSMVPLVGTLREKVLCAIAVTGHVGATDDELEVVTGLSHQTLSARRRELVLDGKLVELGKRRTRSGRLAVVWRLRSDLLKDIL